MRRLPIFREIMYPLTARSWKMRFWFAEKDLDQTKLVDALESVYREVSDCMVTTPSEIETVVLDTLSHHDCSEQLSALEILSAATRKGIVSYFEW